MRQIAAWLQSSQLSKWHRPNQGLSSLTPGDGKMRDPGKEVGCNQIT